MNTKLLVEETRKKCDVINQKAKVIDNPIRSMRGIRLMRVPPELIDIEYNPITGNIKYYYSLPKITRNEIVMGKKSIIETIPHAYIEALKRGERIKFTDGSLFHFKRPSSSDADIYGWGEPLVQPVLTDAFYMQVLRKAQEAIMYGCIVPLRVIFPQAGDSTTSPFQNVNLMRWTNTMKSELIKWRRDPNHVPIVPMPMGAQIVGGEGKTLTLFQELEITANEICNGMGVPIELYKGGLSWSGSNMSLRLLENKFLNHRKAMHKFCNEFVIKKIAAFLDMPSVELTFTKFKMADDLQRTALEFQLWQSQLMSASTVLAGMDHDYNKEQELIVKEQKDQVSMQKRMQLSNAQIQGEMSVLQAKYQAQAQKKMMQMSAPSVTPQQTVQPTFQDAASQGNLQQQDSTFSTEIDMTQMIPKMVGEIEKMNPQEKQMVLSQVQGTAPQLYIRLVQEIENRKGSSHNPLTSALPEVKPSRAEAPVI